MPLKVLLFIKHGQTICGRTMKISTSNDICFIFEFPLYFWPANASDPIRILHISNIWTFCNFYSGYIDVCSECMLYSFEHSLPHVGRKSVFLFMYLLHVLQYPQSTTSPTKKIWRQKETTFCSYPTNKHII